MSVLQKLNAYLYDVKEGRKPRPALVKTKERADWMILHRNQFPFDGRFYVVEWTNLRGGVWQGIPQRKNYDH